MGITFLHLEHLLFAGLAQIAHCVELCSRFQLEVEPIIAVSIFWAADLQVSKHEGAFKQAAPVIVAWRIGAFVPDLGG